MIPLVALLVAGAASASSPPSSRPPRVATRSKGSPTAPVTVYEMSDFQCPYCRRFALETFRAIEKEYIVPGKVRWVFVNFPLTSIHANAVAAAGTALCAARQGAFWPVHDLLYTHQDTWAPLKEPGPFFLSLADSAGISKPKLLECVKVAGHRVGDPLRGRRGRAGGREQHAELLHRGRPARPAPSRCRSSARSSTRSTP